MFCHTKETNVIHLLFVSTAAKIIILFKIFSCVNCESLSNNTSQNHKKTQMSWEKKTNTLTPPVQKVAHTSPPPLKKMHENKKQHSYRSQKVA